MANTSPKKPKNNESGVSPGLARLIDKSPGLATLIDKSPGSIK